MVEEADAPSPTVHLSSTIRLTSLERRPDLAQIVTCLCVFFFLFPIIILVIILHDTQRTQE